jgi:hypothetical protein
VHKDTSVSEIAIGLGGLAIRPVCTTDLVETNGFGGMLRINLF